MAETGLVATQQSQWPYVVISFIVATIGSATSLLIMKQRTSASGLRNRLYLLAGAVAFGAVGVFSMHFIGMQALHLIRPDTGERLPMVYLPIPTAFSLFVVVSMAIVGFVMAGDPLKQQWWRYVVGGIAGAGGSLVMHYLGMTAMDMQAEIKFNVEWIVGSVIIGVAVVSVALLVFFRFRDAWRRNNLVLVACSLLLATGVCGVHYSGMQTATYYILDQLPSDLSVHPDPDILLVITVVLASLSCLVTLTFVALKYYHSIIAERSSSALSSTLSASTPTHQSSPP